MPFLFFVDRVINFQKCLKNTVLSFSYDINCYHTFIGVYGDDPVRIKFKDSSNQLVRFMWAGPAVCVCV